ncbi:sensor histidine kinase [Bacillus sp. B-jedd]|uniref:sensor histidine kinase n=1 Tax=Bacillus sp. B-jedd TaxID=1476857 RepID=UPI0005155D04|nr:HAMP domain-containing sensor histidine kinase [Bacillus sp. B-jedd]CEG29035.1 histidine kinase [Bacillus sp. B-jedd]
MISWQIIILLISLLIIAVCMLLLFHWDVKKMTKQLEEINNNFGTNELVRTNTHNKSLVRFAAKINQLIHLFKQNQQSVERREMELKQEITNISHDLRTPLTSIKGFSDLLKDPSISEAERKEFLDIIQKKIDNLTMIVELFYELSQLDSSDKKLTIEKQFLDQIVVDTMLMFYEDFEKEQLEVQMAEDPVPAVLADNKATVRIVTNIIQNALTYAKSYLKISFIEEEDYIWLRAVNDVENINASKLQSVFNRTFRLDTSRKGTHLGLGLHIVQQLITKQGGKAVANVHENEFILEVSFRKCCDSSELVGNNYGRHFKLH